MKYLQKFLLPVCMFLAGGGFLGCSDDPTPPPTPDPEPTAELTVGTVGTNSAEFVLKTANVTDFAYILSSDPTEVAPDPAIFFGTTDAVAATDGDNKFSVRDLEAETEYRVFVAYRSKDKFGEVITSETFTTGKYSQFLTIIETDAYDALKFHIEVPAGKTIAWTAIDYDQFFGMEGFGNIAPNYFQQAKEFVNTITESQTIVFKGSTGIDPETGEEVEYPVGVGQPHIVFAAEVEDRGEVDGYERPMWSPLFDYDKYMEDMMGGGGGIDPGPLSNRVIEEYARDYDKYWTTDYYAMYLTQVRPWEKWDAEVGIEVLKKTIKTVTLGFTPDEKMYNYGVTYMDVASFESMTQQYGSEDFAVWYAAQYATAFTDPAEVTFGADYPLEDGMVYRAIVVASANPEQTLVSVQYYDFEVGKPTKDPAKVIVKGIPAPAGETASPWTVWFNVKCPNKDAVSASYLAESTTEFVRTLNQGMTYTTMFSSPGFANPFSASEVAMINSDEGMNIMFSCWEDTDNRLAVQVVNDEDVATNPDTDPDAVADYRSTREPDAPRVESELFSSLQGDWTLTADITAYYYKYDDNGTLLGQDWWPDTKTVKVTISDEPAYPSPMPESVYALYPTMTREQVNALYNDFKNSSSKFAQKTRGQNRILCEGLDLNPSERYYGKELTQYNSPWDLFVSESYGSARITDDLFVDFGPKWFLKVSEGDKVVLDTDYTRIQPAFYNRQGSPVYLVGVTPIKTENGQDSYQYATFKEFPVTIAADGLSFTVDPAHSADDGKDYTPALATIDNYSGNASPISITTSFTMTKGWTEPAPASTAVSNRSMGAIQPRSIAPADGKGIRAHRVHPRTSMVYMLGKKATGTYVQHDAKFFDPSVKRAELERKAQAMNSSRR